MADGFLGRWSRRKIEVREGRPLDEPQPETVVAKVPSPSHSDKPLIPAVPESAELSQQDLQKPEPEPPTLEDTEQLTPQSDFKPFVARGVNPDVKNAALKKLFSDPHFSSIDGLDIYLADYSLPDPLPLAMMRQMTSAKFLDMFDEKKDAEAKARGQAVRDDADSPPRESVAESQPASGAPQGLPDKNPEPSEDSQTAMPDGETQMNQPTDTPDHANTDLRLQQDHAAGAENSRRSTE